MAFSFRPRLLLWSTACGAGAWTVGFLWIVTRPGVVTNRAIGTDLPTMLASYFDPHYAFVLKYRTGSSCSWSSARVWRSSSGARARW